MPAIRDGIRSCLTRAVSPSFPHRFLAGGQAQYVLPLPDQPDRPALRGQRLHRRCLEVLLGDDQLAAQLELHDVSRVGPDVDDLADGSPDRGLVVCDLCIRIGQPDLLGPDGEDAVLADDGARRLPGQQVAGPDEPGDEGRGRVLVDVGRRADLLDPAAVEDRQAVAHGERLFLVVGDVDEGDPDLRLDRLQLDLHLLAKLQVQRAQRLVQQQHAGTVHQGARQRHPLPLAARQLRRLGVPRTPRAGPCAAPRGRVPGARASAPSGRRARRRRCRRPTCAGTARSPGRRCSRPDRRAARRSRRVPCSSTRPSLGCSKPAIMRRVVVLPDPDGPSIEKNSPSAMSRSTPETASTSPKRLITPSSRTAETGAAGSDDGLLEGSEDATVGGSEVIGSTATCSSRLLGTTPRRWARLTREASEDWRTVPVRRGGVKPIPAIAGQGSAAIRKAGPPRPRKPPKRGC